MPCSYELQENASVLKPSYWTLSLKLQSSVAETNLDKNIFDESSFLSFV